jgi:hypothetical protein
MSDKLIFLEWWAEHKTDGGKYGNRRSAQNAFLAALAIGRKEENKAIVDYIVDNGTIETKGGNVTFWVSDADIAEIRQRIKE